MLERTRRPVAQADVTPHDYRSYMRSTSAYVFARRGLQALVRKGARSFAAEAAGRLVARLRYGIPLSSPASYVRINLDYQKWMRAKALSPGDVVRIQSDTEALTYRPLISILVPVYNTNRAQLRDCIASVLAQVYPNWELCLVDDASTLPHVRAVLNQLRDRDQRIKVSYRTRNVGIAAASQAALDLATGDFVVLLDHDDELTPDALFEIVRLLARRPDLDLIYTDEDMRAPRGKLVQPFFKPGWSPDLLREMNYITHLSVFRTQLVRAVGGFREEFEGSQDYDLLLRVSEKTDRVGHVPRVLYHWRKTAGSVTLDPYAKSYAYDSAVKALEESATRRGYSATIDRKNPGHYRLRYKVSERLPVTIISIGPTPNLGSTAYPSVEITAYAFLSDALQDAGNFRPYLLVCDGMMEVIHPEWLDALVEHAQRSEVGAVGPTLVDEKNRIVAAGLIIGGAKLADSAFSGCDATEGDIYNGILQSTRNCSALTRCLMVRRTVAEQVAPLATRLRSPAAEIDLCLRLRRLGYSVICTPYSRVRCLGGRLEWQPDDRERVRELWAEELSRGDPFLNQNLVMTRDGVRIDPRTFVRAT